MSVKVADTIVSMNPDEFPAMMGESVNLVKSDSTEKSLQAMYEDGELGGDGTVQFVGTKAQWNALSDEEKEKYDGKEVILTDDTSSDGGGESSESNFPPITWDFSSSLPNDTSKVYTVSKTTTANNYATKNISFSKSDMTHLESSTTICYVYEQDYILEHKDIKGITVSFGDHTVVCNKSGKNFVGLVYLEGEAGEQAKTLEFMYKTETNKFCVTYNDTRKIDEPDDSYSFTVVETYTNKYIQGELVAYNGVEWVILNPKGSTFIDKIESNDGISNYSFENGNITEYSATPSARFERKITQDKESVEITDNEGAVGVRDFSATSSYFENYMDMQEDNTGYFGINHNYEGEENTNAVELGVICGGETTKVEISDGNIDLSASSVNINGKPINKDFYIFMSDSYDDAGYGGGWISKCAGFLGLSSDQWVNKSKSGGSFQAGTWISKITEYRNSITEEQAKKVTHIVLGGGINDCLTDGINNYSTQSSVSAYISHLATKVNEFMSYVIAQFPNATFYYCPVGYALETSEVLAGRGIDSRRFCYAYIRETLTMRPHTSIPVNTEFIFHNKYFMYTGDYLHPNSNGCLQIARYIAQAVKVGAVYPHLTRHDVSITHSDNHRAETYYKLNEEMLSDKVVIRYCNLTFFDFTVGLSFDWTDLGELDCAYFQCFNPVACYISMDMGEGSAHSVINTTGFLMCDTDRHLKLSIIDVKENDWSYKTYNNVKTMNITVPEINIPSDLC